MMERVHYKSAIFFLMALFFLSTGNSCNKKKSDTEIQQTINEQLQTDQGYKNVSATVKDGVATLTGTCAGENCEQAIAEKVKGIEGVDQVENNITREDTGIDYTLRTSVQSIISKYEGVQADVAGGVVVLRGSIQRSQLQPLMAELSTLKAKKIDNQLAVK
ncbi:MAG: BON domain-containing protein [Flavisolibacter sp.]|nr:BON domain-containing protein [Flavisolibacter sp.]